MESPFGSVNRLRIKFKQINYYEYVENLFSYNRKNQI